jgi:hypothetical protein
MQNLQLHIKSSKVLEEPYYLSHMTTTNSRKRTLKVLKKLGEQCLKTKRGSPCLDFEAQIEKRA